MLNVGYAMKCHHRYRSDYLTNLIQFVDFNPGRAGINDGVGSLFKLQSRSQLIAGTFDFRTFVIGRRLPGPQCSSDGFRHLSAETTDPF